ncbi:hypothetical protein FGF04_17720 [Streptomyces apricus]|uniref:Uncharacterized protein n=1 Tax=Streptomyces apricus TaxID=1828112 RepID=A0A5B0B0K8_9ACTN|nr:hypothetical protein FGF04_17720 [Streptomyces apricus]
MEARSSAACSSSSAAKSGARRRTSSTSSLLVDLLRGSCFPVYQGSVFPVLRDGPNSVISHKSAAPACPAVRQGANWRLIHGDRGRCRR